MSNHKDLIMKLTTFLNSHRYSPDTGDIITHVGYGCMTNGKFVIKEDSIDQFFSIYEQLVKEKIPVSILEVQKEYSMIIVDIDLKAEIDDTDTNPLDYRLYNDNMVDNLINKYIRAICKYLDTTYLRSKFVVAVLEKPEVTVSDKYIKDGFHLMFPYVCANKETRHLIWAEVIKLCKEEDNPFEDFVDQSIESIIDRAVISSNAWFLYGSSKPARDPYVVTRLLSCTSLVKLPGNYNFIRTLSIHYKKNRYSVSEKTPYAKGINDIVIKDEYQSIWGLQRDNKFNETKNISDDVIGDVCVLLKLIKNERSTDYSSWINIGLCLHNIHDDLILLWKEFSSRCPSKYNERECDRKWNSFRSNIDGNLLTIRTLHYYAKLDSPTEYSQFIHTKSSEILKNNLSTSSYNIAKVFYNKYPDKYVCSCIKENVWWVFDIHRWRKMSDASEIYKLLSEDLVSDYFKEISSISNYGSLHTSNERITEECSDKIKLIHKIISMLRDYSTKDKIVKELKTFYIDDQFEIKKLDSNNNLIGFLNGVYELDTDTFRHGRPDDYISLCTETNYVKYSEKLEYVKDIKIFFEQVMVNPVLREYLLTILSLCLSGDTNHERVFIFIGCGSNGKSLTIDLVNYALGKYYMSAPITMFTRKRGNAGTPSPEMVRLKGKRMAVFQETDDDEVLNTGFMKEISGGDRILIRDLYKGAGDMIEMKPQFKMFIVCNNLPKVQALDDGTWRRLRVIDFTSKFVDNPDPNNSYEFLIDTSMKKKIKYWGPTFTIMLLELYKKQRKQDILVDPDIVTESTMKYKRENDGYYEFILEHLVKTNDENDKVNKNSLIPILRSWHKLDSFKNMKGRQHLAGLCKILKDPDEHGNWVGYKLRSDDDEN
jgi:P4 family phage/plasmid primase-like protien